MKIGYRRVSSIDQNLDRQDLGHLDKVFEEKLSGSSAKQAFTGYALKSGEEKVDAVADALIKLLDGLIATRRQIGAVSGQLTLK